MHFSSGATRTVLVTKNLAFKFPRFYKKGRKFEWNLFLNGLLANLQEKLWSKPGYKQLCPVYFADPIGLLLIMPRCEQLGYSTNHAMNDRKFQKFKSLGKNSGEVPIENVECNFGYLNGKLVSFDYGT